MAYTLVAPQPAASLYQLVPPSSTGSPDEDTPPAAVSGAPKYRLESPTGEPVKHRSFGEVLKEGAEAVGADIKHMIIDPAVETVKMPGDVLKGKYGPAGSKSLEEAARNEAINLELAGAGRSVVPRPRAAAAAIPAEAPKPLAAEPPKPSVEEPPAAATPPQPSPTPAATAAQPPAGPLTRAPALTKPRTFEDQLFQLEGNKVADRLDVMKALDQVPAGIKPETWEKLYHHEEDPKGVALTPEEQAIYDKHVAPLKAEGDQLAAMNAEGYTPRYVAGRTRSFGEVLDQWKQGVEARFGGAPGRSMRKTVDAQKSRRFWNAVNPETGDRTVVHVGTDGTVLGFDGSTDPVELGRFGKGQKLGDGAKIRVGGDTWRLDPATTKEIESVAQTRYQKNVLANRLDNLAKLRSAVRNAKFIDDMKASPDWDKIAVKVSDTATPPKTNGRAWRIPKMPQFRQFYMEPHLADALDDALGRQRDIEGLEGALDKAGNLIKGSIFWNPLPHMRNVANHYFVEKGLAGTLTSVPSTFRSLLKAARSVATQDQDYTRILRSGASLPYARFITRDVHKALIAKLGEDVAEHPAEWSRIASLAGKANPVELIRALYTTSNKALWEFGDILEVARVMELEGKGRSLEAA